MLETYGYRAYTAERPSEAMEFLDKNPVDLVLTDVIMPEMDGYELAQQIMHRYPDIKIQLTSGFTDQYHSEYINTELHRKLLVKPFTRINLLRSVRSELDGE